MLADLQQSSGRKRESEQVSPELLVDFQRTCIAEGAKDWTGELPQGMASKGGDLEGDNGRHQLERARSVSAATA